MKKINMTFQAITMFFWALLLTGTDCYYLPYLVVTIFAFLCLYLNQKESDFTENRKRRIFIKACAMIFSLMVLLANYSLYLPLDYLHGGYHLVLFLLLGVGGFFIAWNILEFLAHKCLKKYQKRTVRCKISPAIVWGTTFAIISFINITILFTCKYPGTLSPDSIAQIDQIMSGVYTNHHPFYHTMVIKFFVSVGLRVFGDMNASVASYHVFQILFMSLCFSFVVFTLCEMEIPLKRIVLIICYYALMPFHIMYSFTMWKDVMFSGFMTVFIVMFYRILQKEDKKRIIDYFILLISSLGVCLFRSNGFLVFIFTFVVYCFLFGKERKRICFLMLGVIFISFLMKHPMLDLLGVKQSEVVEAISVPAQQIARVAVDYNDFTQDQRELLSQVIEMEKIPEYYTPYISDPIKTLIRFSGNQEYIADNKFSFIKLYIQVGLKHPLTYVKAWVDQTRGFWNAGYDYWRWSDAIYDNGYGIKRITNLEMLNNHFNKYLCVFSTNPFLQIFLCIGFCVWIYLLLCYICVIRHDKIKLLLLIPILGLIASLIISTPVYAEFRYAYPIICALPFLICVVL